MISFFRFPSLFNSLGPVKDFLIDATSSLFSGQNLTDFNFAIPQKMLGGSIKINVKQVQIKRLHFKFQNFLLIQLEAFRMFSNTGPYQDVILPGFGIAQDYVNQIIKVVLNTITVLSYK